MPSVRQSAETAQPVADVSNFPSSFPQLPASMRQRFGDEAAAYDQKIARWWTATRRVMAEAQASVAGQTNQTVADVDDLYKKSGDMTARVDSITTTYATKTFAEAKKAEAITASNSYAAAQVASEAAVRAGADGNLAAKYTLKVAAGEVITGLNLTSISGPGTDYSGITLQTDNLKVVTATGAPVDLMTVDATDFIFGTDIKSDSYVTGVSGWKLSKAGTAELANAIIRGALYSTVGSIGGFILASNTLTAGSGTTAVELNSNLARLRVGTATGSAALSFMEYGIIGLENTSAVLAAMTYNSSFGGYGTVIAGTSSGPTVVLDGLSGAVTAVNFMVGGTQVVTAQQALVANAGTSNSLDATYNQSQLETLFNAFGAKINEVLTRIRTHGLIAT